MTILIDLALLLIGAVATLSAFGGKTWTEGQEPVIQRITPRGWISLVCLVLALVLGVTKSVVTKLDQNRKDAVATVDFKAMHSLNPELELPEKRHLR